MTVSVSFMKPDGIGSINAPGLGRCRTRETITVPGTTTASLEAGEIALLCSGESAVVLAAAGTTPDAQATTATAATQAGVPVPPNVFVPVVGKVGEKINIKVMA